MAFKGTEVSTFTVADEGLYVCKLTEIKQTEKKKFQSEEKEPGLAFVFETVEEVDENGKPYQFRKITGVRFGSDRAALTEMVKSLAGRRITTEEYEELTEDEFVGKLYELYIEVEESGDGRKFNNIKACKPKTGKKKGGAVKQATETLDDLGDPFSDQ